MNSPLASQGFTLLEIIVAIAILSILVLAITLIPALRLGQVNNVNTYATDVARETLEAYRGSWSFAKGFQDAVTPTLPSNLANGCTLKAPVVTDLDLKLNSAGTSYDLVAHPAVLGKSYPDVRRIQVIVSCVNRGDVSLQTEIADPQPEASST